MIPSWLATGNPPAGMLPAGSGNAGFLEKTLSAAAAFTGKIVLSEAHAGRAGFLQKVDPRFRLSGILLLIVAVSFFRTPWSVWGICLLALILAFFSRIGLCFFVGRAFPLVFFFGALIALPAVFSVSTPGEPLWVVAHLGRSREIGPYRIPAEIAVTRQGLMWAVVFAGRVAASVSLALLLTLTSRWNELLQALRVLRVPHLFILVLAMTYRYLVLLVHTVSDMLTARKSRTARYGSTAAEQHWMTSRMGFLFRKSFRMGNEVHDAMLSRGFSGKMRGMETFRVRGRDVAWLCLVMILCALTVMLDRR